MLNTRYRSRANPLNALQRESNFSPFLRLYFRLEPGSFIRNEGEEKFTTRINCKRKLLIRMIISHFRQICNETYKYTHFYSEINASRFLQRAVKIMLFDRVVVFLERERFYPVWERRERRVYSILLLIKFAMRMKRDLPSRSGRSPRLWRPDFT